ncbi:serine hydrolase [Pseudoclavibacter sp. 13-3]|uniref:serine hydrolase n=1 Tax=Pseudoclavibacter sp. 13-3 TaxID=2901228 RepID=UPI001E530A7F|nr:metallo-hydrolase family protein [Pseudoclavibacter sp. 13-3]
MALATAALVAVIPFASANAAAAQPVDDLQATLDHLVAAADAQHVKVAVTVQDLSGTYGDAVLTAGAHDAPFKAASTIKLGLTASLMHQVDQGKLSLDTPITIQPSDVVGGSGTIQSNPAALPKDFTLAQLIELMITVSDNTATNRLIDVAGGFDAVNAYTQSIGLQDSGFHLGRKMILPHTAEQENWISSDEDAKLLTQIYQAAEAGPTTPGIISQQSAQQVIAWMRAQKVNTKFGAVVPRDVLANKTGENTDVSHDTGYILVPGKEVAISVMTSFAPSDFANWDTAFATANTQVQQVAKAVYDYQLVDHAVTPVDPVDPVDPVTPIDPEGDTQTPSAPAPTDPTSPAVTESPASAEQSTDSRSDQQALAQTGAPTSGIAAGLALLAAGGVLVGLATRRRALHR